MQGPGNPNLIPRLKTRRQRSAQMGPVNNGRNQPGDQAVLPELRLGTGPNGCNFGPVKHANVPVLTPEPLQKQLHPPSAGEHQPGGAVRRFHSRIPGRVGLQGHRSDGRRLQDLRAQLPQPARQAPATLPGTGHHHPAAEQGQFFPPGKFLPATAYAAHQENGRRPDLRLGRPAGQALQIRRHSRLLRRGPLL